jgi:3-phenylpropionate/trans-cinnamate dioxygenase ferredoxin reductase subunit
VVHGDLGGAFVAVTGGEGRLQAAVGIGMVKPLLAYRKLLAAGASWDEALAA